MTPCQAACGALVAKPGRCVKCKRVAEARRERTDHHLYGARWRRESASRLRAYPFCACTQRLEGRDPQCDGMAVLTDHIVPHKGDPALFWDPTNWQSMSKRCHDVKTATEDGGFGNTRKAA